MSIASKIRLIRRYLWAIVGFLVVSLFFFGVPFLIWGLKGLTPIGMAIGGLLFSIPLRLFWETFKQPVLEIKKEIEIEEIPVGEEWTFNANRIIVENKGRSAAKNCKGWIIDGNNKKRVCWAIPKERPNATINVKDAERLDFCAYYKGGPKDLKSHKGVPLPEKIAPTEGGWHPHPYGAEDLSHRTKCEVLITSGNARPINAEVIFEKDKINLTLSI